MNLDYYEKFARASRRYKNEDRFNYLPLQLSSEAGEVAGKFAKALRKGVDFDTEAVLLELGDVLWYTTNLTHELGYTLSDIAEMNMKKLTSRIERGVINGDGDNR